MKRALALLFSAAMLAGACGDSDDTTGTGSGGTGSAGDEGGGGGEEVVEGDQTGITDSEILLGTSNALSGPASAYAVITGALDACAAWVNDEGGITMADGTARQLRVVSYDDAYDPAKTVENARRLIEEDQVFALWAMLGTPTNTAIYDYTNDEEVPNLFVATGASKWGVGFIGEHPWTIGWQPAYSTEAAIYATWLEENHPDSTVAILMQNDDYGEDYINAFKHAIEGTSISIVAEQTYETTDPTVEQQVTDLASSGADVFFNVTTPKFAAQAITKIGQLSWDPIHLLNSVSASIGGVLQPAGLDNSTGIISSHYYKDPTDAVWDEDEGMQEYNELVAKYGPQLNTDDPFVLFGWAQCLSMKHLLENSQPTRQSVIETVGNLDGVENALLLPGITMKTGPDDGFPIEAMQIVQFNGTEFENVGELVDFEGRTPTE